MSAAATTGLPRAGGGDRVMGKQPSGGGDREAAAGRWRRPRDAAAHACDKPLGRSAGGAGTVHAGDNRVKEE